MYLLFAAGREAAVLAVLVVVQAGAGADEAVGPGALLAGLQDQGEGEGQGQPAQGKAVSSTGLQL